MELVKFDLFSQLCLCIYAGLASVNDVFQCDWKGALKAMDHATNDMPRTEHRLSVFTLSYLMCNT